MSHRKSRIASLSAAALAIVLFNSLLSNSAVAGGGTIIWAHIDEKNGVIHWIKEFDEGDMHYVILAIESGDILHSVELRPAGNPNPEGDDYPEPGDHSSREALAKQNGNDEYQDETAFELSPVGTSETAAGRGLAVVVNPSDDEDEGGASAPPRGESFDSDDVMEMLEEFMAQDQGLRQDPLDSRA